MFSQCQNSGCSHEFRGFRTNPQGFLHQTQKLLSTDVLFPLLQNQDESFKKLQQPYHTRRQLNEGTCLATVMQHPVLCPENLISKVPAQHLFKVIKAWIKKKTQPKTQTKKLPTPKTQTNPNQPTKKTPNHHHHHPKKPKPQELAYKRHQYWRQIFFLNYLLKD